MKLIKSSWSGFEIDSSEYSASYALENPYEGLKTLFSSAERSQIKCVEIVINFKNAIQIALLENPSLVEDIEVDKSKLVSIYKKYKDKQDSLLTKENILEIVKAVEVFLTHFPHLAYEFYKSIVYVYGRPHSIVGVAFTFTFELQSNFGDWQPSEIYRYC